MVFKIKLSNIYSVRWQGNCHWSFECC